MNKKTALLGQPLLPQGKNRKPLDHWYAQVFDNMSEALVLLEVADGNRFRSVEVNPAFEKTTGMPRAELVGKFLEETIPQATAQRTLATYHRCLSSGSITTDETTLDLPSGRRTLHSTLIPISDQSGTVRGIVGLCRDHTERLASTRKYALMQYALDHVHEEAFLIDESGRFEYVNREACRALGYETNELRAKTVFDVDPDVVPESWPARWQERKSKGPHIFESRHLGKDGVVYPVEIYSCYFAFEGQGYILALARNISAQKQAERERLANLKFFESMDKVNRAIQRTDDLDRMMSGVLDAVLEIFECDRAFLMSPCDPEAASWRVPMERNKPEYPGVLELGLEMPMDKEVAATLRLLLEADGPVKFGPGTEYPLPSEVAARFGFKCFMSMALYPKVGKPWQFGIHQCSYARIWTPEEEKLFQEIGHRLTDSLASMLMLRNLHQREMEFRTLAENSPDNIARYDRQSRPVYINPRLAAFLGYDPTDLYGKTCQEIHPDGAYADYFAMLKKVMATGSPAEMEMPIPGSVDGVHLIHFVPEYDEHGQVIGALAIGRDITDYKRAQTRLAQQEAEIAANKTAITVLLNHGRQSESEIQENVQATLDKMVLPYLDQAAQLVSGNAPASAAIQLARECLQQVTAPFSKKLSAPALGLSPRELQIADLIRQGQSTKEIAAYLHLAPGTVEFYRDRLRRKLQIKNKKTNLRTYLTALHGIEPCAAPPSSMPLT